MKRRVTIYKRAVLHRSEPIIFKDGAWIGTYAVVVGGVTIGTRAVVGASTVVTKDVPDRGIVVGMGARLLAADPAENTWLPAMAEEKR